VGGSLAPRSIGRTSWTSFVIPILAALVFL
jgi:hypothetical protein